MEAWPYEIEPTPRCEMRERPLPTSACSGRDQVPQLLPRVRIGRADSPPCRDLRLAGQRGMASAENVLLAVQDIEARLIERGPDQRSRPSRVRHPKSSLVQSHQLRAAVAPRMLVHADLRSP